jgi:DNA repair exonuclease SbcCD ATPase subunit
VGLREEKKVSDPINNDLASVGLLENSMGAESEMLNEDARQVKERYETRMVELKTELNEQNEMLLRLIEEKEEQKIQIFAREQSIELQQKQIQTLLEKVRELKRADNDQRQLINMKIALEEEVARLKKDLDSRDSVNQERDFEQGDLLERLQVANETIIEQAKKYKQLSAENGKTISRLDLEIKNK